MKVLSDESYFLAYYKIEDYDYPSGLKEMRPLIDQSIIVVYWAFTTLSTVGFGDYNPRSDSERLMCAFLCYLELPFSVILWEYSLKS